MWDIIRPFFVCVSFYWDFDGRKKIAALKKKMQIEKGYESAYGRY